MKKPRGRAWAGWSGSSKVGFPGPAWMLLVWVLGACSATAHPSGAPRSATSPSAAPQEVARPDTQEQQRQQARSQELAQLFKPESLDALRQRGGFARRRVRDVFTPVDISLADAHQGFGPLASLPPTPKSSNSSTASFADPTPTLQSGPTSGTLSNAARVVAGMRAGFRNCYQRALARERTLEGGVRLLLKVGPGGDVLVVQALALGLPPSCVDCILERAVAARFEPPEGGSAVIAVPVTFVKTR